MRRLSVVVLVAGMSACLLVPAGQSAPDEELAEIVAGADCEEPTVNNNSAKLHCNQCNTITQKVECTSTFFNQKCKTHTDPYGCIACSVVPANCGGNKIEYVATPCSGNSNPIGPCRRKYDKGVPATCATQQTCP